MCRKCKRMQIALIGAVISFYVSQIYNFWLRQDLMNDYLDCRRKIQALQQENANLEYLKKIYNILAPFETQQEGGEADVYSEGMFGVNCEGRR